MALQGKPHSAHSAHGAARIISAPRHTPPTSKSLALVHDPHRAHSDALHRLRASLQADRPRHFRIQDHTRYAFLTAPRALHTFFFDQTRRTGRAANRRLGAAIKAFGPDGSRPSTSQTARRGSTPTKAGRRPSPRPCGRGATIYESSGSPMRGRKRGVSPTASLMGDTLLSPHCPYIRRCCPCVSRPHLAAPGHGPARAIGESAGWRCWRRWRHWPGNPRPPIQTWASQVSVTHPLHARDGAGEAAGSTRSSLQGGCGPQRVSRSGKPSALLAPSPGPGPMRQQPPRFGYSTAEQRSRCQPLAGLAAGHGSL